MGGYDPIAQAETGLMYMIGHPDAKPVRADGSVVDVLAGLHAGMAVMGALRAREAGGAGQMVDIALFGVAMSTIGFILQGVLLTGNDPPRAGNVSFFMCPNGVYPCSDSDVMMSAGNDRSHVYAGRTQIDHQEGNTLLRAPGLLLSVREAGSGEVTRRTSVLTGRKRRCRSRRRCR